jgi:phosphoribosylformylglycinamidine synthase
MTDLLSGRRDLREFAGLAACGGFSYGDVLGAGGGWARRSCSIRACARSLPTSFRAATASRSACATVARCCRCSRESFPVPRTGRDSVPTVPGSSRHASAWSRCCPRRSVLLEGMAGSRLLVPTSHGEGRAEFAAPDDLAACEAAGTARDPLCRQSRGAGALYPANPNGSPGGIAGLCSADGRVTILMPHPERVQRSVQHSWHPPDWDATRDPGCACSATRGCSWGRSVVLWEGLLVGAASAAIARQNICG